MPSTNQVTMATVLNTLPSYVDVTITTERNGKTSEYKCLTRDFPTNDPNRERRLTCLTTGFEWFITAEALERMDVVTMVIAPQTITMVVG
jgi:hypothetical protein